MNITTQAYPDNAECVHPKTRQLVHQQSKSNTGPLSSYTETYDKEKHEGSRLKYCQIHGIYLNWVLTSNSYVENEWVGIKGGDGV